MLSWLSVQSPGPVRLLLGLTSLFWGLRVLLGEAPIDHFTLAPGLLIGLGLFLIGLSLYQIIVACGYSHKLTPHLTYLLMVGWLFVLVRCLPAKEIPVSLFNFSYLALLCYWLLWRDR